MAASMASNGLWMMMSCKLLAQPSSVAVRSTLCNSHTIIPDIKHVVKVLILIYGRFSCQKLLPRIAELADIDGLAGCTSIRANHDDRINHQASINNKACDKASRSLDTTES
jgi:hypothetical protein